MLEDNLARRLTAIAIYLEHAKTNGLDNTSKSAYYRAAILLTASIIEGLVFQLVKEHSEKTSNFIRKEIIYKEAETFSAKYRRFDNQCLVKQEISEVNIHGQNTFNHFIKYINTHKVLSSKDIESLEYVRKERNRIHIQSLEEPDIGYTKRKFNKLSKPLDFLTKKLL